MSPAIDRAVMVAVNPTPDANNASAVGISAHPSKMRAPKQRLPSRRLRHVISGRRGRSTTFHAGITSAACNGAQQRRADIMRSTAV
jgi:hypothetical protein